SASAMLRSISCTAAVSCPVRASATPSVLRACASTAALSPVASSTSASARPAQAMAAALSPPRKARRPISSKTSAPPTRPPPAPARRARAPRDARPRLLARPGFPVERTELAIQACRPGRFGQWLYGAQHRLEAGLRLRAAAAQREHVAQVLAHRERLDVVGAR